MAVGLATTYYWISFPVQIKSRLKGIPHLILFDGLNSEERDKAPVEIWKLLLPLLTPH